MSAADNREWMETLLGKLEAAGVSAEVMTPVRIVFEYAKTAIALHRTLPGGKLDDVAVNRVNLKPAPRSPHKTMLVVAGVQKRQPVVTFHTGPPGLDVFHEFLQRFATGHLKWLPDTPVHAAEPGPDVTSLPPLPGP